MPDNRLEHIVDENNLIGRYIAARAILLASAAKKSDRVTPLWDMAIAERPTRT